jgi:thiaminase/transcriptional activator TenA
VTFSEHAWRSVQPWFSAITTHPFLCQLADGTLSEHVFLRYLLDDAHYLNGYSSALAALAARAAEPDARAMLAGSAAGAIRAERTLHRGFLLPRGIDPDSERAAEPSPTCAAYTAGLRAAAALEPIGVAMAAVLPCFRVYAEVARWIVHTTANDSRSDHPYRAWIATYADPAFAEAVDRAEAYANRLHRVAGAAEQQAMLTAYHRSTRLEWMFWHAAWQGERWPEP